MSDEITYQVIQAVKVIKWCPRCSGSGKESQKAYHNRVIEQQCSYCHGTGKYIYTNETRVDLLEALQKLNIIKPADGK